MFFFSLTVHNTFFHTDGLTDLLQPFSATYFKTVFDLIVLIIFGGRLACDAVHGALDTLELLAQGPGVSSQKFGI